MIKDREYIKDPLNANIGNSNKLRLYIEKRLCDYGYKEEMNPSKYQAYTAIRRAVTLRTGIESRGLNDIQLDRMIEAVDIILPKKEN